MPEAEEGLPHFLDGPGKALLHFGNVPEQPGDGVGLRSRLPAPLFFAEASTAASVAERTRSATSLKYSSSFMLPPGSPARLLKTRWGRLVSLSTGWTRATL